MTQNCAILGASGFVGGELMRLLSAHPDLALAQAYAQSSAGTVLGEGHPHLCAAYGDLRYRSLDALELEGVDLIFAALPHGVSQQIAPFILESGIPFVDLGADFRLDSADEFAAWYGEAHQCPEHLGDFLYGIPELGADFSGAKAVAAAGCYATAAILTLKPLVDAGLFGEGTIIVDGMSGVSGAGKEPKASTHFDRIHGGISAYGLLHHRHTAEMEMALRRDVLFTPHLVPMDRGILVTCHGRAATSCDPMAVLREAYADSAFVHVVEDSPSTKAVAGSNGAQVTARYDERTGQILALGVIDNLGKGAAGQMIQCANLMLGLEETAGLSTIGVYP